VAGENRVRRENEREGERDIPEILVGERMKGCEASAVAVGVEYDCKLRAERGEGEGGEIITIIIRIIIIEIIPSLLILSHSPSLFLLSSPSLPLSLPLSHTTATTTPILPKMNRIAQRAFRNRVPAQFFLLLPRQFFQIQFEIRGRAFERFRAFELLFGFLIGRRRCGGEYGFLRASKEKKNGEKKRERGKGKSKGKGEYI